MEIVYESIKAVRNYADEAKIKKEHYQTALALTYLIGLKIHRSEKDKESKQDKEFVRQLCFLGSAIATEQVNRYPITASSK